MLRPFRSGSVAHRLMLTAVGVVVLGALYVTCAAPQAQAVARHEIEAKTLRVVWAGSNFAVREPPGAVVSLHVVARNDSEAATQATTVRWSPEFASIYQFLGSTPSAAHSRLDDSGWGTAEVTGLAPREELEIALFFQVAEGVAPPSHDLFPRVHVLADEGLGMGLRFVGERLAVPLHAPERLKLRAQLALDDSAAARLVERAPFLPVTARAVFAPAVAFAVLLLCIIGAGLAATLRATQRAP